MRLSDFDFHLPEEAIARHPAPDRDGARLMVLQRRTGEIDHRRFRDLPELLARGDLVVANDTRVLRARLAATKVGTGGRVEILLVEPLGELTPLRWRAMVNASKPVRPAQRLALAGGGEVEVVASEGEGFVVLDLPEPAEALTARCGAMPLPPYLGREAEPEDDTRYQTIFARPDEARSVAAPTAGLHFTPQVLADLAARGIERTALTLHVGPGTFLPVRSDDVTSHRMHAERFDLPAEAVAQIAAAQARGGRVVAVGTTVTRVLEASVALAPRRGSTDLFIRPGHLFRHVDAMVTNFHLPRSTLLMLVSAFAGRELILEAYRTAVKERYRFFSYGDAMLIL